MIHLCRIVVTSELICESSRYMINAQEISFVVPYAVMCCVFLINVLYFSVLYSTFCHSMSKVEVL